MSRCVFCYCIIPSNCTLSCIFVVQDCHYIIELFLRSLLFSSLHIFSAYIICYQFDYTLPSLSCILQCAINRIIIGLNWMLSYYSIFAHYVPSLFHFSFHLHFVNFCIEVQFCHLDIAFVLELEQNIISDYANNT